MNFIQATGLYDHKTVVNIAFGCIDGERKETYSGFCEQLDLIRRELHIPIPSVIIIDEKPVLKLVLRHVFPRTQQQLCIWHINSRLWDKIKLEWNLDDFQDPQEGCECFQNTNSYKTSNVSLLSLDILEGREHNSQAMLLAWGELFMLRVTQSFKRHGQV